MIVSTNLRAGVDPETRMCHAVPVTKQEREIIRELTDTVEHPDLSSFPLTELHDAILVRVARIATSKAEIQDLVVEALRRETVRDLAAATGFSPAAVHRWPLRNLRRAS